MNQQIQGGEVQKSITELNNKLRELKNIKTNVYTGSNYIDKAHIWLYYLCAKVFGLQESCMDKGITDMSFDKNEFVLLSFNSYRGVINSIADVSKSRNRYNLFKKGRVWSSPELNFGNNFYYFLNELSNIFGDNPINTISKCNYKAVSQKENKLMIEVKTTYDINDDCIYFPQGSYFDTHIDEEIKNSHYIIRQYLSDNYLKSPTPKDADEDLNKLKVDKVKLLNKLRGDDEIKKVIASFRKVFSLSDAYLENNSLKDSIICSAFIYSYNHLPFDLTLFYPEIKDSTEYENYSVLMITKAKSAISEALQNTYKSIANLCELVSEIEKKIVDEIKNSLEIQLKWELEYQKRLFSYHSFTGVIENICRAICRQNNIKAEITSRTKAFPSFFNKIYQRANDGSKIEGDIKYNEVLESHISTHKYFERVFSHIRDIAGVRIICVYESDVKKLQDIFKRNFECKDDIVVSNIKNYRQNRVHCDDPEHNQEEYNYRGFHLTVSPGKIRLQLTEFKNLGEIQCEIQIRTILAHGWSDVQHPMEYKNSIPIIDVDADLSSEIELVLSGISKILKEQDEKIRELKNKVDELSIPMDRY